MRNETEESSCFFHCGSVVITLVINITNCCFKQFSLNANCKQMPF